MVSEPANNYTCHMDQVMGNLLPSIIGRRITMPSPSLILSLVK